MAQNNPFFGNPLDTVTDEIRARRYALPDFSEVRSTPDAAGTSPRPASGNGLLPPPEYEPLFVTAGQQYQVPINVLMALGQQESSYNPGAIGVMTKWGRAKGMMQYIDPTAESMGIDPLDPAQAVDAAARQFQDRIQNRGYTVEEAIMAHHGGDDRAQWGPKTRQYLKDVLGKAAAIRQQWRPPEARGVTSTAIRSAEQVAQAAAEAPIQGDLSQGPGDQAAREQVAALREQARDPSQVDAMTGADLKLNDPNAPKPQTPLDLIRRGLEGANDFLKTPASEIDLLTRKAKGPADGLPGERPAGGRLGDVAGSIEAATRDPGAFTGERARDAAPDALTGADRKITEPDTTWTGWVTNLAKEVTSGGVSSAGSSVEGLGLIGQQMANVEAGRQLSRAANRFDRARQTLAKTLKANQAQDPQTILERSQGHAERLAQAETEFHRALVEEASREPDKVADWLRQQGVDIGKLAQELKADPEYAGVAADLASGVGSMLTYLGPGFVTTLMTRGSTAAIRSIAGIAGASALAGPAGAAEAYQRAKKHGLPEDEAVRVAMAGIPAGIVQVAPVAVILKKIPEGVRGKAVAQFRHLLESFGAEFTAEGAGAVMQNLVEKSYNPDKGTWDDSLYQAAIGGSSAALITLGVQLATRGRGIGPIDAGDVGREMNRSLKDVEWASTPEMEALRLMDPAEYLGRIRVQVEEAAGPEATLDGDIGQPQGPAPAGPIERATAETAAEDAVAQVPGERVTVETRTGKLTGTVEDYFEDGDGGFQVQVLSDDGEVYVFDQDSQAVIIRDDQVGEAPSTQAPAEGGEKTPESSSPAPAETPPMADQAPGEAAETPEAEPEDAAARRHAARADQRIAFLDIAESEQDVEDLIAAEMADPDLPSSATSEARNRFLQAAGARAKALAGTSTASQAESTTTDEEAFVAHEPAPREPQAEPASTGEAQAASTGEPIVEHVTQRGKRKRGVVRDIPKAEATAIDTYAFKKNGGWFINLERLEKAQEAPDATQEGQVPESDQREHQDREEGGQAPETGRGDRPGHGATQQGQEQEALAQQYQTAVEAEIKKEKARMMRLRKGASTPAGRKKLATSEARLRGLRKTVFQAPPEGWTPGAPVAEKAAPAESRVPPIADARREDRKRDTRQQGREAALEGDPRELPEWLQGDAELENEFLAGYGEGIAQRSQQQPESNVEDNAQDTTPVVDNETAETSDKPQASDNTIFTEDAAAAARERLRKRLGTLNSGIDPEMMMDGITLAGYHIEKGARTFAAYAKAMVEDLGPAAKPYLKSWYAGVYFDPRAESFDGMTEPSEMQGMDIDTVLGETNAVPEVDKVGAVDRLRAIGVSPKRAGTAKTTLEEANDALRRLDHSIVTNGIDRMTGATMGEIADALGLPKSGRVAERREALRQWRAVNTDARLEEIAQVAAAYRKGELTAKDALEQGLITQYPQAFPPKVRAIARDTGGTGRYDWQKPLDDYLADRYADNPARIPEARDAALALATGDQRTPHLRAIDAATDFGLEVPVEVTESYTQARAEEQAAPAEPSRDDARADRKARVKSVATAAVDLDLRSATGDERSLLEDVKATLEDPELDRGWTREQRGAVQRRRGKYISEAFDVVKAAEAGETTSETSETDATRTETDALVGAQVTPEVFAELMSDAEAAEDPRSPFVTAPTITRAADAAKQAGTLSLEDAQDRVERWKAHARAQGDSGVNSGKVVLSLFEVSGELTRPWVEAGYDVQTFDIQTGTDIAEFDVERLMEEVEGGLENVHAVLACPPCTDFAGSGARWWAEKDAAGKTEASKELVRQVLNTVELVRPPVWMIENPVGRMARVMGMPHPTLTFQPHHYGDPFTKKTLLWGDFNPNLPQANVDPSQGSRVHKLSGRDKDARSETPEGFAYAFFMANNAEDMVPLDLLAKQFRGIDPVVLNDALASGLTPEQIRSLIEDDYHDVNLEAAESALRDAIRMQHPGYQAERERLKERQEEIRAGAQGGDAHAQAWADLQFHYVERELREQEAQAREQQPVPEMPDNVDERAWRFAGIVQSGGYSQREIAVLASIIHKGSGPVTTDDVRNAAALARGENPFGPGVDLEAPFREAGMMTPKQVRKLTGAFETPESTDVAPPAPAPEPVDMTRPTDEVLRPASRAPRWRTRKGAEKHRDQRDLLGIYAPEAEANGWILRRLPTFTLQVTEHRHMSTANSATPAEVTTTVLLRPEGMSLDLFKALVAAKLRVKPSQIIQNGRAVKASVAQIQRLVDHLEAEVVDLRGDDLVSQTPIRGGSADDTQGDSAAGTQPLVDATPEGAVSAEHGTDPAPVDGIRPSRTHGDGQPDSDRSRREDGVERGEVAGTESATQPGGDRGGDPAVGPGGGHRAPASDSLNRDEDRPHTLAGENPGNFVIPEDFKLGQGTTGQKIKDNLAALEVMLAANAEQRFATPAEQKILARYVGWGGLSQVFDPKHRGKSDQYGRAHAWLKAHLTAEQFAAANRSIQDAHYTSDRVVAMMWQAARHFGFQGGRALEPTVGTGNFLGLAPADLAGATEWHAAELDDVSGRIAQLLYPEANILAATGFQDAPFADGVMDLAIGNPPFGQQPIRDRSKRRGHLDGMKIHNYIIAKAGMHLRPGGVMQMVVTHRFLDTADPEGRRELAKHFRLLGAVRLPNDAFKATAGTEVTTDMVYLQKLREGEAPDTGAAWLDTAGEIEVDGVTMRVNRYFQDHPQNILGKSALTGSMYQGQGKEYTVESDGRDIAADFARILSQGSLADLAGVMTQTDIDRDGQAVMLERSDLPVGGMTLTPEGTIIQRDHDDADGNSVINTITPESYWREQAAQWEEVIDAAQAIKASMERTGSPTPKDVYDFEQAMGVATLASGNRKPKPTKAEQAVYDIYDNLLGPTKPWHFDAGLAAMQATLTRKQLGRKGYDTLRKLLDLRNRTLDLVYAERANSPSMETRRQALNEAYDAFVKSYGLITDPRNLSLLAGDVGVEVGLETNYQPEIKPAEAKEMGIKPTQARADKADILTRRVIWPERVIEHADNALDGMSISLSEKGRLDLAYIARLVGKPQPEVTQELLDEEAIFYDPEQRDFVTADEYLSGNVKHKLQVAQENGQADNVAALEKVQPEPKTQKQITPSLRGTWLPTALFEDFLAALGLKKPRVLVQPSIGRIAAREAVGEPSELGLQFSDPDVSMVQLFNAAAAGKSLKVMRKGDDDTSYEDKGASQRVTAKAERMALVFREWAYSDADRAQAVVDAYNRTMNTHRQRAYNGEKYLKIVGQSPSIKLRRTQKNAAWRMIQSQNVLTDHIVGAGKTFTLITGIMERRRLGLSRKPAIVVPNHLVVQWASEFYQLYPGARILAATPDDFAKKNRRRLFARIATGDYDAIIMGHSSFGFIEAPQADVRAVIAENKAKLQAAMEEAKANGESGRTLKQMQKKLDTYDDQLRSLAERPRDEMGVDFEAMGIDYLAVDECFPYDTQVETDRGLMPIGEIVEKRLRVNVKSWNSESGEVEWKPVVNWHTNPRRGKLVEVFHEHGSFICTPTHKVWVEGHGYRRAGDLRASDRLVINRAAGPQARPQDHGQLRMVRDGGFVSGVEAEALLQRLLQDADAAPDARVAGQMASGHDAHLAGFTAQGQDEPECQRANEAGQPDAEPRGPGEDESDAQGDGASAEGAGRKRQADRASEATRRGDGHGDGARGEHAPDPASHGAPAESLQDRPGLSDGKAGGGTGREFAPKPQGARAGREKGAGLVVARLAGIAVLEPGRDGEYEFGGRDHPVVYDIEVADNHNYFADGALVSNSHMFKNLEYATSGERVVGMNDPKGSGRAFDLYTKLRGLQNRDGGVTFATGTPVSNSLVELYTMMRYLAPDALKARDQDHFDAWAGAYAVTETRMEYTATQKLKPRRVLSGLANLDGLGQLYREFADIITMDDLKRIYSEEKRESNAATGANERTEFPVPKVKHGGRQLDTGEITAQQSEYMDYLVARMQAIEANKQDPEYARIDNPLWVLGDARKMSLDVRVVDPTARRDENGKVMRSARKIKDLYDRWEADKGTQMVFSDLSTPAKTSGKAARKIVADGLQVVFGEAEGKRAHKRLKDMSMAEQWTYVQEAAAQVMEDPAITPAKVEAIEAYLEHHAFADSTMQVADTGFSVYDDLRTVLTEMGIPAHEIAFIHDYNTPEQKARLFARVNSGAIRVLIGSTEKMGAGTNAQARLVGLHHLDAPWRPSDVEQREGRIIRQGNTLYERDPDGFEVEITAYSTNGTSDTVMWQVLERKAAAIEQFRQAGLDAMQEEGADSDQYAEFMAASTGNPVFRLKLEAERDLTNIQAEVGGKLIAVQNARTFMDRFPETTARLKRRIAGLEAMETGDIVLDGETGSLEGLEAAWEAAKAKFLEDHAAWNTEYDRVHAEREALRAEGHKKLPALPAAPAEPTLMSPAILEASGYARLIKAALEDATAGSKGDNRLVPVTIGNVSLEIERRLRANGNISYTVNLVLPDNMRTNLALSDAKNPVDAPSLVNALMPRRIKEAIGWEMSSVRNGLADLEARVERERGLAKETVDETPITEAQALLDWYKDQVKLAEYEADARRGERQNRYIAGDRTRPLSTFKQREAVQARQFTLGGETFTTTGLAAVEGGGRLTVHEATRDRDGHRAMVYETKSQNEVVTSVVVEPEAARAQRRAATAQSNARATRRTPRQSVAEVTQRLRQGRHGQVVGRLLDRGRIVVSDRVPVELPRTTAAYVDEDGTIHLIARNLDPRTQEATLLHELFHAGARPLIGSRRWNELQERLGKLYHQAERSSGYNRQFWEAAHVRIAAAEAAGDVMGHARRIEEFGAYAIEEFASAPRTLRHWASEVIGLVKAWLNRVFGIQAGEVTPAQLKALAAAALRNGEMAPSPALGPQTAPDTAAFKRWFGDSQAVNSAGQPKVYYHGTFSDFSEFQSSGQARGLIFVTDQIGVAEQYAEGLRAGYQETGRQFEMAEIGNLLEDHPQHFDGHRMRPVADRDALSMMLFDSNIGEVERIGERLDDGEIDNAQAVDAFNEFVDGLVFGGSLMPVYVKAERPYGYRTMPLHWRQAEGMGAERLRAEGYDSVWVTEGDGAALAVLDSSQIKSAIGNRGTFDPASPDITLSVDNAPLVDRDGNPVPERERKAELNKAVRKARKALSVVQQDGVNDRDGGVVRDILKPTALLTQPYTIASMEPAFTPVFRTGMAQMRFRDTLIAEMYPRFQAYKELRADSRAKVNQVLELGRLSGLSFSDSRLRTGVQNRGYKTVVSHDPTGLPMRRQEPLHAALTRPGEVVTLTREEIAAYRELRVMFDEALDLFRDQTLIDMDMADFIGSKDPVGDILAAISGDMSDATKERYQSIAKMVEEIEQAKRTGYVPLARYGRFVITVREKIAKVKYAKNPDGGFIARGVPDTLADFMREIGATWNDLEDGWQVSEGQRRQLSRETTRTVYSEKLDPERYAQRWETWRAAKAGKRPDQLSFIKEAKARIEAEWGGEGRRINVLDTKRARLEGGLKLSDIDSLADMAQVDPATWEAIRDDFVKAMKGRGFRKHFFRADHVPGYELDFERAIADYIAGMAGYLSRRHHDKQWETAIGKVRGPNLSAYSREYRDYLNNPAEEWAVLRQTGFLFYIAGNVSTALLNATQVPIMTLPALSQVMSHAKAAKHVTGAYTDALRMTSLYDQARQGYAQGGVAGAADSMLQMFDPEDAPADVRAEVRAAWEDGMFSPQFTHEVMGFSNRRDGSAQARLEKTIDYVAASYTYIERLNRLVTFIAAVRAAKDPKVQARAQTALKDNHLARATLLDDNWSPKAFGEFIVDESQFLMGKVNRAKVLRSHGAAIFQFMSFVINSLQAWYRWSAVNGRDGKFATAYSIAAITALSGVWGAPGMEYLRKGIEQLWLTLTGEDEDLRYNLREWVGRTTGSDMLGEIVDKGSFYPLGADMSGRIGFMRMLPDMSSPVAMGGIPLDLLIGRPSRAAKAALQGNYGGAVAELSPNFLKNPITAHEWSRKGVVSRGGNQAVTPEQIPTHAYWYKALGIQPSIVSDAWEYKLAKSRLQRSASDAKTRLVNKLARAEADASRNDDPARQPALEARIERLYQDVDAFNDANPDQWLDPRTLNRRVRNKLNEYLYGFDQIGPVPAPDVERARQVYNIDDMAERGRQGGP